MKVYFELLSGGVKPKLIKVGLFSKLAKKAIEHSEKRLLSIVEALKVLRTKKINAVISLGDSSTFETNARITFYSSTTGSVIGGERICELIGLFGEDPEDFTSLYEHKFPEDKAMENVQNWVNVFKSYLKSFKDELVYKLKDVEKELADFDDL